MSSGLPTRAFQPSLDTQAFWDATVNGSFLLRECTACETIIWYPRPHCPECGSTGVEWITSSGRGVIYSFTVTRSGQGAWKPVGPYVLAYVELDEGPRVLTNIVGCDPGDIRIGMPVHVVFDDAVEGAAIYRFTPTTTG